MSDAREILKHLRIQSTSAFNRLKSINEDAEFVSSIAVAYPQLPLVANLRCGAWYTDPHKSLDEPVYFKSTDGHFGQWAFNLRRANLHLLPIIAKHGGLILVDSTRRGKRIPDALSKTVPIWCAVVNRAIQQQFPENKEDWADNSTLFAPPSTVSPSEYAQITPLIDKWARKLLDSAFTLIDLPKPLRPLWVTPATTSFPLLDHVNFFPIVCLSASKLVPDGLEMRAAAGYTYVQGSGDDHELWSNGLTPELFWANRGRLMAADEHDLTALIDSLAQGNIAPVQHPDDLSFIEATHSRLSVGSSSGPPMLVNDQRVVIMLQSNPNPEPIPSPASMLILPIHSGKRGQMQFMQQVLPQGVDYARRALSESKDVSIITDAKDIDHALGLAIAVLASCFDEQGQAVHHRRNNHKPGIRKRLHWIQESRPGANPSRTTMNRINEFLMSDKSLRSSFTSPASHGNVI